MFGWFQKPKQVDPKLTRAYEMGQRASNQFAEDLQKLMDTRFKPTFDGYLGVLQGQLNKSLAPTDAPPILSARIEYNVFVENVAELNDKMTAEIVATLSGWMDVADQIESRDIFLELIQVTVQKYCRDLKDTGLQRLLDMAYALKAADDPWRAANPELSAKFPPDT